MIVNRRISGTKMGLIVQTVPENYCKSAKIEIAKIKQYCRLQLKILNH